MLRKAGKKSVAIEGDMSQNKREDSMQRFRKAKVDILVATDVAARGLDIKDLAAVINYDLFPQPDVYIHRIGRTGRAGKEGLALSLYSKREEYKLEAIKEFQGKKLQREQITSLPEPSEASRLPPMVTLCISGGKKQKVRPGDILGALTGEAGIPGQNVGKIDIFVHFAYVAIKRNSAKKALERLNNGKIKGRFFKVRQI